MFSVEEFSAGPLNDAKPLALLYPTTQQPGPILVGRHGDKRTALFLDKENRFRGFLFDWNESFRGLIVNNVSIEMDPSAISDPNYLDYPLGSIIRQGTGLYIQGIVDNSFQRRHTICLIDGLSPLPDRHGVAFARWQLVYGQGLEKRVLMKFDLSS